MDLTIITLRALWHGGILISRITAILLFLLLFGHWLLPFLTLHWIFMIGYSIRYATHRSINNKWDILTYHCFYGLIYCFDFFEPFSNDNSRMRLLPFYCLLYAENLTIVLLYIFLSDRQWLASILVTFVVSSIVGLTSLVLYHQRSSQLIQKYSTNKSIEVSSSQEQEMANTSKNLESSDNKCEVETTINTTINDIDFHSVVENDSFNSSNSVSDINKKKRHCICLPIEIDSLPTESNLTNIIRRGICSSTETDLNFANPEVKLDLKEKVLQENIDDNNTEDSDNKTIDIEAPSEILSTHDYENICAVNIAREKWGLRSWQGYCDIETYFHDDSTVHDRRRDTLTSTATSGSSELSSQDSNFPKIAMQTRADDYDEPIEFDLDNCSDNTSNLDIETNIFKAEPYISDQHGTFHPLVSGPLESIQEELEESSSSNSTPKLPHSSRSTSISALVATIDEIRLGSTTNSPYRFRDRKFTSPYNSISDYTLDYDDRKISWNDKDIFHSPQTNTKNTKLSFDHNYIPTEFTLDQILFLSELRRDSHEVDSKLESEYDVTKSVINLLNACDIITNNTEKLDLTKTRTPRKLSLFREKIEPKVKIRHENKNSIESVDSIEENNCNLTGSCDDLVNSNKTLTKNKHNFFLKQMISPAKVNAFKIKM